jgi:hypothetical protein
MPLTNLSFETVAMDGVSPAGWTISFVSSVEELDVLASGGVNETFESGWNSNQSFEYALTLANSAENTWTNPVTTTPLTVETFEVGWNSNQTYDFALAGALLAFSNGVMGGGDETFEYGWDSNQSFEWAYFATSSQALFGGSTAERFVGGWLPNTYETALVVGTNAFSNTFAGNFAEAKETFEHALADQPIQSVDTVAGWLTVATNTFLSNESVQFYETTGQMPGGIVPDTIFTVGAVSGSQFKVQLNGTTVVPSSEGTGILYVTDPTEFWTVLISL